MSSTIEHRITGFGSDQLSQLTAGTAAMTTAVHAVTINGLNSFFAVSKDGKKIGWKTNAGNRATVKNLSNKQRESLGGQTITVDALPETMRSKKATAGKATLAEAKRKTKEFKSKINEGAGMTATMILENGKNLFINLEGRDAKRQKVEAKILLGTSFANLESKKCRKIAKPTTPSAETKPETDTTPDKDAAGPEAPQDEARG